MNLLFVILYLTNFLRTIGIIVLLYYVFKFVGRLLFPVLVKKAVNNMQARQGNTQHEQKREGEVTIETKQSRQSKTSSNEGEYDDFEEIE